LEAQPILEEAEAEEVLLCIYPKMPFILMELMVLEPIREKVEVTVAQEEQQDVLRQQQAELIPIILEELVQMEAGMVAQAE